MLHRTLIIGRWVADFLFAPDGYEKEEILTVLYEMGAPERLVHRVYDIIESNRLNTGFTFTNDQNLTALVVVGPTSSGEEFINTLVHEVHHLAVAIASNLGIDLESEAPAYLVGDSAFELADLICDLGCKRCN